MEPAAAPSSVTVFVKPSGRDPKEAFALVSVAALGLKDETLYGTLLVTSADSLLILLQPASHSLSVTTPLLSALATLK